MPFRCPLLLAAPCALLAVLLPASARADDFDKLLPADTAIVVSINLRQIVDSPLLKERSRLGKILTLLGSDPKELKKFLQGKDIKDADMRDWQKGFQKQLGQYGIDAAALGLETFRDVHRVSFGCAPDQELRNGLLVVEGTFVPDKFQAEARKAAVKIPKEFKINQRQGFEVWEVFAPATPGKPLAIVSLLNSKTLVLTSDRKTLQHALDQAAGNKKAVLDGPLQQLLEKREAGEAISYVLRDAAVKAAGKAFLERPEIKNALQKPSVALVLKGLQPGLQKYSDLVTAASVGLKLEKDFAFRISLNTKNAKDAQDVRFRIDQAVLVAMLAVLKIEDENTQKLWLDFLYDVQVRADGPVVSIQGRVEAARFGEFLKLLQL